MKRAREEHHASYGVAQFNRVSSTGKSRLFGSPIDHHYGTIRLRISEAYRVVEEDGDAEYFMNKKCFVEVEMSASQFAELISNMNHGVGVPVTVRRVGVTPVDEPPTGKVHAQEVREDFKKRMQDFAARFKTDHARIATLLKGSGVLKRDHRQEILDAVSRVFTEVASNIPYFLATYEEAADKVTSAAKSEIDALMTRTLVQLGIQKLKEDPDAAKKLLSPAEARLNHAPGCQVHDGGRCTCEFRKNGGAS